MFTYSVLHWSTNNVILAGVGACPPRLPTSYFRGIMHFRFA